MCATFKSNTAAMCLGDRPNANSVEKNRGLRNDFPDYVMTVCIRAFGRRGLNGAHKSRVIV